MTVSGPFGLSTRWVNSTMSPTGDAICSPDRDAEVATSKPGGTNALLESTVPPGPMTQVHTGVRVATMTFERSAPLRICATAVSSASLPSFAARSSRRVSTVCTSTIDATPNAMPNTSAAATVTRNRTDPNVRRNASRIRAIIGRFGLPLHSRLALPGSRRRAR